jgi:riboflavin synthase
MFTGIVEETGVLQYIDSTSLVIQAKLVLQDLTVKDSIAVDGICLTVTEQGESWFRVDVMPETLRRTRLSTLRAGDMVNLERSLVANGRMGGHIVQGHVEATAQVLAVHPDGIGLDVEIERPEQLAPYIIAKGFIAINGISLTVVDSLPDRFSISLIPYTREHTNLGQVQIGTILNLETDIVGRYLLQSSAPYAQNRLSELVHSS